MPELDLRPLAVGDRVAHREDHDWHEAGGTVVEPSVPDVYFVRWDGETAVCGPYDRGDLVVSDDPDIDADEDGRY